MPEIPVKKDSFPKHGDNFTNARKFTKDDERWFKGFGEAMEAFRQKYERAK